MLTESGAFKALALDLCEALSLELPAMEAATAERMRAAIPDFIPVSNPMDLTAQALVDPDLYRRTLEPLLDDPTYGSVIMGIIQTDEATARMKFLPIIEAIRTLKPGKPVIFAGLDDGADVPAEFIRDLRALGVCLFRLARPRLSRRRASRAAREPGFRQRRCWAGGGGPAGRWRRDPGISRQAIAGAAWRAIPQGWLRARRGGGEGGRGGDRLSGRAQGAGAALSHKSDAGGVILNIADDAALEAAWARLHANVAAHAPDVTLDGALIEAMGARGTELIVGARNDPEWGATILVGFGGVMAEMLHDFRLLPPDLTREAIIAELRLLKSGPLLDGYRGSPALDVGAVADIIAGLGRLLAGSPAIREIDLNPVLVYPDGQGAVALDALILTDPAG